MKNFIFTAVFLLGLFVCFSEAEADKGKPSKPALGPTSSSSSSPSASETTGSPAASPSPSLSPECKLCADRGGTKEMTFEVQSPRSNQVSICAKPKDAQAFCAMELTYLAMPVLTDSGLLSDGAYAVGTPCYCGPKGTCIFDYYEASDPEKKIVVEEAKVGNRIHAPKCPKGETLYNCQLPKDQDWQTAIKWTCAGKCPLPKWSRVQAVVTRYWFVEVWNMAGQQRKKL
jgi:hypothetical protein